MHDEDLDFLNDSKDAFDFFDREGAEALLDEDEQEELLVIPAVKSAVKPAISYKPVVATISEDKAISDIRESIGDVDNREEKYPGKQGDNTSEKHLAHFNSAPASAPSFQAPESIEFYQKKNTDIINSQVSLLNPRAVLFVGTVLSLTLPRSAIIDNEDNFLLFRVLFIEGGSQPAMFRCKTPIFTSSAVNASHNVAVWPDNTFRFDMLMPQLEESGGGKAAGKDRGFVQGEVMLSIYRKRSNGGNDLLAQFSVDLRRMQQRSTREVYRQQHEENGSHNNRRQQQDPQDGEVLEGRSMNGIYPIEMLGRPEGGHSSAGEIEIQFNIAWHNQGDDEDDDGEDEKEREEAIRQAPRVNKASSVNERRTQPRTASAGASRSKVRPTSTVTAVKSSTTAAAAAPNGRPRSAGPASRPSATATAPAGITTTTGRNYEEPRRIVSKLERQRKEMARKIARENQLLYEKITNPRQDGAVVTVGASGSHNGSGIHWTSKSQATSQNKLTAYNAFDAVAGAVKQERRQQAAATITTNSHTVNMGGNGPSANTPAAAPVIATTTVEPRLQQQQLYAPGREERAKQEEATRNQAEQQLRQLEKLHVVLKQEVRSQENTILDLRAQVSKLSTHLLRETTGAEKATRLLNGNTGGGSVAGSVVSQHKARESKGSEDRERNQTPRDPHPMSLSLSSTAAAAAMTKKGKEATNAVVLSLGSLTENDLEYQQLAEEYLVLQKLRRSLRSRIESAQEGIGSADQQQQQIAKQLTKLTHRLRLNPTIDTKVKIPGGDLCADADAKSGPSSNNNNSSVVHGRKVIVEPAESKRAREDKTVTIVEDEKQTKTSNDNEVDEEDVLLYDQYLALRSEVVQLAQQVEESQESMTLLSARQELVHLMTRLTHQTDEVQLTVQQLKQTQAQFVNYSSTETMPQPSAASQTHLTSDTLVDTSSTGHQQQHRRRWMEEKRAFITQMKQWELQLQREESLQVLVAATKEMDLQLVHYRMLAKEREDMAQQATRLQQHPFTASATQLQKQEQEIFGEQREPLQLSHSTSRPNTASNRTIPQVSTMSRPGSPERVLQEADLLPPSASEAALLAELEIWVPSADVT